MITAAIRRPRDAAAAHRVGAILGVTQNIRSGKAETIFPERLSGRFKVAVVLSETNVKIYTIEIVGAGI